MNDQPQDNNRDHFPPPYEAPSAAGTFVPFFLAFLVMVGMAYGGWTLWKVERAKSERGQAIPSGVIGPPLTEFELTERSGETFRSADMRGRVWVATYFFTTCPGSCRVLNQNIQILHNMPELEDVTWVSITCDPQNDTPEVLRAYADTFQADSERWLFCRADMEYTKRVARGMNLALFHQGHQDYAIVIDKAGNMRGVFDATLKSDCQRMTRLLTQLVQEDISEAESIAASEGASSL